MRKIASMMPAGIRLILLRRHLAAGLAADRALAIADCPGGVGPLQARLRRAGPGIEVGLDLRKVLGDKSAYRLLYSRLPAALAVFARAAQEVPSADADVSDGNDVPAGWLAFCARHPDAVLVPDPVFFNSGGHADFRQPSLRLPWVERHDTVLWRGTATGLGALTTPAMAAADLVLRPRVRMCLMLRARPGTDARITKLVGRVTATDRQRLGAHGLLGARIRQADWGRCKLALDIDGYTNAWANLFVRLLLGCCVLKVGSPHGFRQWYYDRLEPWRHFVPVRADLEDLVEKIAWCRGHDRRCAEIAEAGRALAHGMTVESEVAEAARRLDASAGLLAGGPAGRRA